VCFNNWFLPPFFQNLTSFLVPDILHPHPADDPDALSAVPRARCFPPSGGQNDDAAFMFCFTYS
jgi:hypothetical protein